MDEGRENIMCDDAGVLPLIKKVLYIVLVDKGSTGNKQQSTGD